MKKEIKKKGERDLKGGIKAVAIAKDFDGIVDFPFVNSFFRVEE